MRAHHLTLALSALIALPLMADVQGNLQKSFTVHERGKLVVDAAGSDVEVRAGAANGVNVQVLRTAKTNSNEKAKEIFERYPVSITQSGDTVTVSIKHESNMFKWSWGEDIRLKTIVTVPHNFNLDVDTSGGDVSVTDVAGTIDTRTSGGDLTFTRVDGKLSGHTSGGDIALTGNHGGADLHTSGGDVTARDVEGALILKTSGGDISATNINGPLTAYTSGGEIQLASIVGSIDAHTSGGEIDASLAGSPKGDVLLATTGGGVKLTVPSSAAFDLDAETSGGDVSSDLAVSVQGKRESDSLVGRVNGGGVRVKLRSSAGDIRIASK